MTRQLKAATAEAGLGPAQHPQMKITRIASHVLQYDMPEELGYSQQFYSKRTAHIVEVETDEGITGWGECFGPGTVALANRAIVEQVIQPMVLGMDPLDRDPIWHRSTTCCAITARRGCRFRRSPASTSRSGTSPAKWRAAAPQADRRRPSPVGSGLWLRHDAAARGCRFTCRALRRRGRGNQIDGLRRRQDESRAGTAA